MVVTASALPQQLLPFPIFGTVRIPLLLSIGKNLLSVMLIRLLAPTPTAPLLLS
jgi:hypothetical protein